MINVASDTCREGLLEMRLRADELVSGKGHEIDY